MSLYRFRYSRIVSGLTNARQIYQIEFSAPSDSVARDAAEEKWGELLGKKYLSIEFVDLLKVDDWRPS